MGESEVSNPVTPLTPEQTEAAAERASNEGYIHRDLDEVDVGVNVLTGGQNGMTLSTRWGIDALKKKGNHWLAKIGCRILNLFQRNHDAKAAAGDLERAAQVTQTIEGSG